MDKLYSLIDKQMRNPVGFIIAVLAGLGTIYGTLKSAYDFLVNFSSPWGQIISLCMFISIFIISWILMITLSFRKKYRIPIEQRYFFSNVTQTCNIDFSGEKTFIQEKTYIFFKEPLKEDLFDNQLSSVPLKFHKLDYKSNDARVIDTQEISENLYKLYWEPLQGEVEVGIPYKHSFECIYPSQNTSFPNANFITFASSVFIKKVNLLVFTERKICHAVAYKKRTFQSLKNPDAIIKYAKNVKRTYSPPIIITNENSLEWSNENVNSGDVYYLVIFFK